MRQPAVSIHTGAVAGDANGRSMVGLGASVFEGSALFLGVMIVGVLIVMLLSAFLDD